MNQSITKFLEKYPHSTVEEMRAIRREIINIHMWVIRSDYPYLCERWQNLRLIVRLYELQFYDQELQAYK